MIFYININIILYSINGLICYAFYWISIEINEIISSTVISSIVNYAKLIISLNFKLILSKL